MIITAKPTADSLAATAKMKREKSCPQISSKYTENKMKLKFKLNKFNSIPIKRISKFLLFVNTPIKLIENRKKFVEICFKNIFLGIFVKIKKVG